jgi:toxin-antitoxin system PIN domain toxin
VILVDVNILLYARNTDAVQHKAARAWLDRQLSGRDRVGLPWHSLLGFLRISTDLRILSRPLAIEEAWEQVTDWLSATPAWIPVPTERHSSILGRLVAESGVYGQLVPDAHLAALAIEHGLTICSTDGDFARFRQLRWLNPLAIT